MRIKYRSNSTILIFRLTSTQYMETGLYPKRGDVVNCLYPYAIMAIHLKDTNWIDKLKSKIWFKPECEDMLQKALERAKEIIK